jgi:general secretion pathway protein N
MTARYALICTVCYVCVGAMEISTYAATSLDEPTPGEINRGSINVDRTEAARAQARVPVGNPLWAIPLRAMSVTGERPIFSPSRRPAAPPAVIATPAVIRPSPVVAPPAEPEHPNLKLLGTVVSDAESIGVFLDQSTQILVRLKTGEAHSGWILRSVKAREATLEKDSQKETLHLPTVKENDPSKSDNSPD